MSTPVKKVPIHLQSSQNRLLIKNGKTVNEDEIVEQDVYVEDGIIKLLGRNLIIPGGTRVIDARGRYILPGGIDPHTHLEFEFMGATSVDDFYQGTKAAVAGGTTMIIDFVVSKQGETLMDAYQSYRQKADDKVCCDYGLHVCVTQTGAALDAALQDMRTLSSQHGVNSFKIFMAYAFMLNDSEMYSVFERCRELGALALVHAENGQVIAANVARLRSRGVTGPEGHEMSRPEDVEAEAVHRACMIARQVNCPLYVVHVMSQDAAEEVRRARDHPSGNQVYGEVLAAALGTDGSQCRHTCFRHAAGHILSPPLRSDPNTGRALALCLADDTLQLTGSDNCTFSAEQKAVGASDFSKIPNGVNGVEDRMSVVWERCVQSGLMDPTRFVAVTSTNAAKMFNLYPRKGCIAIGSDADLVIWNAANTRTISAKTHHHAVDFNIFEGMECHGVAEFVVVGGRVCVDDGQVRVAQGHGKFIETPVHAPYVYDPEKLVDVKSLAAARNGTLDEVELGNKLAKIEFEPKLSFTPTMPDSAIGTPSCRGARPEGQRNIQDSTFSISEEMDVERKACIRVKNPPGGKSSGFW